MALSEIPHAPGLGQDPRVLDGRYRLDERIGAGGMAEVWRAHDLRLDRDVAVKILPASKPESASQRRKLEREARALAATNHPNIVSVYDYGEAGGEDDEVCPYLVMELVDGPDLHVHLAERGPLPLTEAFGLMGGILAGVGHAHAAGLVHGDLKPANVFIGPHGPKVGDFGVARILDEESTGNTTVAATPTFAAPEVLKGERATAASDVYSAACLAFQLLAGRPPIEGSNAWDVATKHIEGAVPRVKKLRSDVPSELDAAIVRGMDKSPKRRHPDAEAFAAALGSEVAAAPAAPATATVPVSVNGDPAPEPTTALTQPRPSNSAIAVAGPFAGLWERIAARGRRSPNGRFLLLLLIPLLLVFAWLAMRDTGPETKLVPDVVGMRYQEAVADLRDDGYKVDISFRPITEGEPGIVLDTIPAPKDDIAPGGEIHLVAGALAQTPEPTVVVNDSDDDDDGISDGQEIRRERRQGKKKGRDD